MPKAVAKAAIELNEANIMVDVLTDLDVANLRALVMASVASVVAFEEVIARWYAVAPPSPPTAADEASVSVYVLAMMSLSSTSSWPVDPLTRYCTSKRQVIAMDSSTQTNVVGRGGWSKELLEKDWKTWETSESICYRI